MLKQPLHEMLLMQAANATMSIKHTLTPAGLKQHFEDIKQVVQQRWSHSGQISSRGLLVLASQMSVVDL